MNLPRDAELYLDELTTLLAPAEPVDRIEILTGVREHIEARLEALPGEATDEDVRAVLTDLGSPSTVARNSLEGSVASAPSAAQPARPAPVPFLARPWVVPTVIVLLIAASALGILFSGGIMSAPVPDGGTEEFGPILGLGLWELVVLQLSTWPLWLAGLILLWASSHWGVGPKLAASLLPLVVPLATWFAYPAGIAEVGFAVRALLFIGILALLIWKRRRPSEAASG
ncbi:MAG: hypothetical protein Q4G35_04335 [Propionibacteriaceae bacterium]|nr:hypothetical protein [Propionibacteriaceae bacterium]